MRRSRSLPPIGHPPYVNLQRYWARIISGSDKDCLIGDAWPCPIPKQVFDQGRFYIDIDRRLMGVSSQGRFCGRPSVPAFVWTWEQPTVDGSLPLLRLHIQEIK